MCSGNCSPAALPALACSPLPEEPEVVDHGTGTGEKLPDALVPEDYSIKKLAAACASRKARPGSRRAGPACFSDVPAITIYRWAEAAVAHAGLYPSEDINGLPGSNRLALDKQGRRVRDDCRQLRGPTPEQLPRRGPSTRTAGCAAPILRTACRSRARPPRRRSTSTGSTACTTRRASWSCCTATRPAPGLSPDGATAYAANSDRARKVWVACDATAEGALANGRVFVRRHCRGSPRDARRTDGGPRRSRAA